MATLERQSLFILIGTSNGLVQSVSHSLINALYLYFNISVTFWISLTSVFVVTDITSNIQTNKTNPT